MKTPSLFALVLSLLALPLRAAETGQPFKILPHGAAGQQLMWASTPGAGYVVQTSADFSVWTDVDEVTATSATTTWVDPFPRAGAGNFYRITLPQPQVRSVEPVYAAAGAATTIYLLGQCFDGTEQLFVNGIATGGLTLENSGRLSVSLTLAAGAHRIELRNAMGAPLPGGDVIVHANLGGGRLEFPPRYLVPNDPDFDLLRINASTICSPNGDLWCAANGEVSFSKADLIVPGRDLAFYFARTYRSRLGEDRPMGQGWTHSYDIRAQKNSVTSVTVFNGFGRADVFTLGAGGAFECPERFERGAMNGAGTVFTLTFPGGGKWEFDAFGALPPAPNLARIATIRDRNGNALTFAYSAGGLLATIADTLGRNYTLTYAAGRIATLTDFSGRTITYTHDAAGDLIGVRSPAVVGTPHGNDFPAGKTSAYTYSSGTGDPQRDHNLLTVTDGLGQTPLVFTYDAEPNPANLGYDRVTRAQVGSAGQDVVLSYERLVASPGSFFATLRAYVNDKLGHLTEYDYDSLNRPVRIREYNGACVAGTAVTAGANRPGAPLRAGDPAFYETRHEWNADSLCKRTIFPRGNAHEWLWNVDARVAGSTPAHEKARLLVQRQRTDVPGAHDQDEITTRFVHDPRFGAGRGIAFPTVEMGGRGFSTLRSYDARGNLLSVDRARVVASPASPPSGANVFELYDFTYNAAGQLLTRRCPDNGSAHRRFDVFTYDPATGQCASETCDSGGLNLLTQNQYDARGNLVRTVNPRGFDTLITRNALNQPVRVETPSAGAAGRGRTHIFYDANNNVTRTDRANKDENGTVVAANPEFTAQWTFDILNAPLTATVEIDTAATATTAFTYDANRNVTLVRSPEAVAGAQPDNVVRVSYDERDQPFRVVHSPGTPLQSTTQYDYDANGSCVMTTQGLEGAQPRVWLIDWDPFRFGPQPPPLPPLPQPLLPLLGDLNEDRPPEIGVYQKVKLEIPQPAPIEIPPIGGPEPGVTFTNVDPPDVTEGGHTAELDVTDGGSTGEVDVTAGGRTVSDVPPATPPPRPIGLRKKRFRWPGTKPSDNPETIRFWQQHFAENSGPFIGPMPPPEPPRPRIGKKKKFRWLPSMRRLQDTIFGLRWVSDDERRRGEFGEPVGPGLFGEAGRPTSVEDPMGNRTDYNYDADGNPIRKETKGENTDAPGSAGNVPLRITVTTWDSMNFPITVNDAHFNPLTGLDIGDGAGITRYEWTDFGGLESVENDRGFTCTFRYDGAGRFTQYGDPLGNLRLRVLDEAGNVTQEQSNEKSALGSPDQIFIVTHNYDGRDRCTATTDGTGNATSYGYDSNDRPVFTIDPAGTLTRYEWDARDLETGGFTDLDNSGALTAADIAWGRAWDRNARPTAFTDDNAHTTLHVYDSLDRPIRIIGADGTQHQTNYDVHHNAVQTIDQNGTQLADAFDRNNRLAQRNVTPGPGVAATTQQENFAYDGRGFIVNAQTQGAGLLGAILHTTTAAHDSHGNVFSETQDALTTTSTFDGVGNRLTLTHSTGRVVTTAYDALNRPLTVADTTGPVAQFFYIGTRLERALNGNGTRTDFVWDGVFGVANPPGDFGFRRVVHATHVHVPSATVIEDRVFSWDRRQNKTARIDVRPGGPQQMHQYTYDRANRLIATLVNGLAGFIRQTFYALDGANNWQNVNGPGTPNPGAYLMNAGAPTFDFEMNQYTNTPFGPQQYNAAGQTTQLAGAQFFRDYAGRLVGYVPPASPPLVVYDYDALGRRVRRVLNPTGAAQAMSFGFAGGVLVSEIPGAGASRDFVGPAFRGAVNAWLHHDDLGNTLALTNAAGAVLERVEYQDYGVPLFFNAGGASVPASPSGNPQLFCGLYYDTETGLYDEKSWLDTMSAPIGSGGKPDAEKPKMEDFNFTKKADKSSPSLYRGTVGRKGGGSLWDRLRRAMKYDPKTGRRDAADIWVESIQPGTHGNSRDATESNPWSDNYQRIEPAYGPLR